MRSRALRVALAILTLAAIVGAGYVIWTEQGHAAAAVAADQQFDLHTRRSVRALLDAKSAQAAYVAAGQGEDYWISRSDALLTAAREEIGALRSQAQSPQALDELETAFGAFEDFEQLDRRAREYARSSQRLLASDLIFSEGVEGLDATVAALARARDAEIAASESVARGARQRQVLALAGAGALVLLVLLLLVPVPRVAPARAAPQSAPAEPAADLPLSIHRDVPAPAPPPPVPLPHSAAAAPAPPVDLTAIASLCTELGRVQDTRALPSALERAAHVLDASGIVLWVSDPDGRELAPVMAHGYPAHLVTRMGAIPRDAENVTAAAFRTGLVQTVNADGVSPGAIAAPLLTGAGPVGVMAAEVRRERERLETTRAAAAIIAAQLATLLGPPSRSQRQTEAAGA